MKIGIVARAEDRGLGNQTWEVTRHLPHERVLVIRDPGTEEQGLPPHLDRYPGATVTMFDRHKGRLNEREVRNWLDGLDVIYSAETYYDWRMLDWAKQMNVASVLHANPEFYFHWNNPAPEPTVWWSATTWRQCHMPATTRIVPMPVPTDRWPEPDFGDNPRRVLHVGGLEAVRDRNGTQLVQRATRYMRGVKVTIAQQGRTRRARAQMRDVVDYWSLYDVAPVMVLPRRYGGLCLPALEAFGAGLAVVMPRCDPNTMWPIVPLDCTREPNPLETQGGSIQLHQCDPQQIGEVVSDLFDGGDLGSIRRRSREWALSNSWDALAGRWLAEFEYAASLR